MLTIAGGIILALVLMAIWEWLVLIAIIVGLIFWISTWDIPEWFVHLHRKELADKRERLAEEERKRQRALESRPFSERWAEQRRMETLSAMHEPPNTGAE